MRLNKVLLALSLSISVALVAIVVQTHKAQNDPYAVDVPAGTSVAPLPAWVSDAEAQVVYSRFASSGIPTVVVAAYSDTAGVIPDGTVVISDTTSTFPTFKRFGVSPWAGTAITRPRILGIALGNIPARASGQAGRVLIMGYHGNAKMAASGLTGNLLLKTGIGVNGSLNTVADSLTGAVGIFIGGTSSATAANYRGRVFINQPLGKFFGSL